jgi:hypothetical protein
MRYFDEKSHGLDKKSYGLFSKLKLSVIQIWILTNGQTDGHII